MLRSLLFTPANHARRVEKALSLDADAVILDLEDAVASAEKTAARQCVLRSCRAARRGRLYVRINAFDTSWCHADLAAMVVDGVDGIMLPKVAAAWQVQAADWIIANLERAAGLPEGGIDLLPLIETAAGLAAIDTILRGAARVRRVAFGAGDFSLDLGLRSSRDETELAPYRAAIVLASRAAGLEPPIDLVWAELRDGDGFVASARRGAALGFGGKLCIHPDQIAPTHAAFTPSEAEVAQARRIVAAFTEAEARGLASIQLDGLFIDYPIAHRAHRVIAQAAVGKDIP